MNRRMKPTWNLWGEKVGTFIQDWQFKEQTSFLYFYILTGMHQRDLCSVWERQLVKAARGIVSLPKHILSSGFYS